MYHTQTHISRNDFALLHSSKNNQTALQNGKKQLYSSKSSEPRLITILVPSRRDNNRFYLSLVENHFSGTIKTSSSLSFFSLSQALYIRAAYSTSPPLSLSIHIFSHALEIPNNKHHIYNFKRRVILAEPYSCITTRMYHTHTYKTVK